jgi:hypothetical protein
MNQNFQKTHKIFKKLNFNQISKINSVFALHILIF